MRNIHPHTTETIYCCPCLRYIKWIVFHKSHETLTLCNISCSLKTVKKFFVKVFDTKRVLKGTMVMIIMLLMTIQIQANGSDNGYVSTLSTSCCLVRYLINRTQFWIRQDVLSFEPVQKLFKFRLEKSAHLGICLIFLQPQINNKEHNIFDPFITFHSTKTDINGALQLVSLASEEDCFLFLCYWRGNVPTLNYTSHHS